MSDDLGRRRRLTPSSERRSSGGGNSNSWLITIAAAVVVIVAGWFLGMALARFANGPKKQTTTAQVAPSPTASPTEQPTQAPSPAATRATPKPARVVAKATPTAVPTTSPTPQPTVAPTVAPTARPIAAATPQRRHTMPVARRPERVIPTRRPATPPPVVPRTPAETVVRAYIEALRQGNPQTAGSYLANGSPDESFIDSHTVVTSINSAREADGTYVVAVEMQTPQGKYLETFDVASTPSGTQILQKSVTRP